MYQKNRITKHNPVDGKTFFNILNVGLRLVSTKIIVDRDLHLISGSWVSENS